MAFIDILIPILTGLASFFTAWWTKGRFEKRVLSADTHKKELDTYSELALDFQQKFVNLHAEVAKKTALEYENKDLKTIIAEQNEQLTLKNSEIYLLKEEIKRLKDHE